MIPLGRTFKEDIIKDMEKESQEAGTPLDTYFPFIDGLRALSVISIVLFHTYFIFLCMTF